MPAKSRSSIQVHLIDDSFQVIHDAVDVIHAACTVENDADECRHRLPSHVRRWPKAEATVGNFYFAGLPRVQETD
jgi:hypothetical protein